MNLVGRYERIRKWGPSGIQGPPYILDRKQAVLLPVENSDEWWRSPDGIWIPTVSGAAGFQGVRATPPLTTGNFLTGNLTTTDTALSSAYTSGSAGTAFAHRWLCNGSLTVNNIYFYVVSYTGTAANVNDINYEVRTGSADTPTTSGGGLVASGTKDPASATGWINISGLSISITAGYVWFIIADADGNGTDFATIRARWRDTDPMQLTQVPTSTTNGWSAVSYGSNQVPNIVVMFSAGNPIGSSITTQTNLGSDTNRKGLLIDSLLAPLNVYGWVFNTGNVGVNGIELYSGSTNPGGSTVASSTTVVNKDTTGSTSGAIFTSSSAGASATGTVTLAANTQYRCVFTYGASYTKPDQLAIGTGTDANLRKALPRAGWYYTKANGTTNWSNDDINSYPSMVLLIDDQVAPAAAGGVMRANMDGGMI